MPLTASARSNLFQSIDSMSEADLDLLPHGAIQLDTKGVVLKYNTYESQLANLDKGKVVGRNFFKEVAPCTDVKEFYDASRKASQPRNFTRNSAIIFPSRKILAI
jgi:photoactive yellow protein